MCASESVKERSSPASARSKHCSGQRRASSLLQMGRERTLRSCLLVWAAVERPQPHRMRALPCSSAHTAAPREGLRTSSRTLSRFALMEMRKRVGATRAVDPSSWTGQPRRRHDRRTGSGSLAKGRSLRTPLGRPGLCSKSPGSGEGSQPHALPVASLGAGMEWSSTDRGKWQQRTEADPQAGKIGLLLVDRHTVCIIHSSPSPPPSCSNQCQLHKSNRGTACRRRRAAFTL